MTNSIFESPADIHCVKISSSYYAFFSFQNITSQYLQSISKARHSQGYSLATASIFPDQTEFLRLIRESYLIDVISFMYSVSLHPHLLGQSLNLKPFYLFFISTFPSLPVRSSICKDTSINFRTVSQSS